MKTTCTECYGEPDLYHGCEDCGRPPRRHLIPAEELAKLDAEREAPTWRNRGAWGSGPHLIDPNGHPSQNRND